MSAPEVNAVEGDSHAQDQVPQTPVTPITANAVISLHSLIKQNTQLADETSRSRLQRHIQKLANATQMSFAERDLLEEQIQFLAKINNEAKVRRSTKSIILDAGSGIVFSYEHLVKAREDRAIKDAEKEAKKIANKAKKAAKATQAAQAPEGKKKRGRKRKIDALDANTPARKATLIRGSKRQAVEVEEDTVGTSEAEIPPAPWRAPVAKMW